MFDLFKNREGIDLIHQLAKEVEEDKNVSLSISEEEREMIQDLPYHGTFFCRQMATLALNPFRAEVIQENYTKVLRLYLDLGGESQQEMDKLLYTTIEMQNAVPDINDEKRVAIGERRGVFAEELQIPETSTHYIRKNRDFLNLIIPEKEIVKQQLFTWGVRLIASDYLLNEKKILKEIEELLVRTGFESQHFIEAIKSYQTKKSGLSENSMHSTSG